MNKLKALSVLFRCAELYRDNLVGNNLLFVCSDKHLNMKMFPVAFLAGNFMHLTGVKFKGKAQSSVAFYNEYKMSPTSISNVIKLNIIVSTAFPLRGRWQPKADG